MKCFPFACCAFRDHARGRSQSNALFEPNFVPGAHAGHLKHGRACFPPLPKGQSDVLLLGGAGGGEMPYLPGCHTGCC